MVEESKVEEKLADNQEVKNLLAKLNERLHPYQLAWVHIERDCLHAKKNARFMTKEQMKRLAANVKEDGFLSQLPFGIKRGDKYEIISGNHRMDAAIRAELEYMLILYLDQSEVSEKKVLAIQLSHNSISGQDDISILAELYSMIDDLDLKGYSGINELDLQKNTPSDLGTINEADINLIRLQFMVTKAKLDQVEDVLKALETRAFAEDSDRLIIGDFKEIVKIITEIKKKHNIKNDTVAFLKMIDICKEHLREEDDMPEEINQEV